MQFYEQDDALTDSVGAYAVAQLKQNGRMLVVATPGHRKAVAEYVRAAGIDLDDARASGSYIALDAAETLSRFTRGDGLDVGRFDEVIGGMVEKLSADGHALSAFGEMVALLWADGKRKQALQLEELWNALKRKKRFGLFCAYPLSAFSTADATEAFASICASHSRVIPTEAYANGAGLNDDQRRQLALVEQRAAALEAEVKKHRHTEEKLRKREAELGAFVETASIGLHWVNEDGIIIWANQAELSLLGYSTDEYVGRRIADFHVDEAAIDDLLARLRRGERLHDHEAQMRCRDGSIKTVLIDSSVLWDEGRFVHTQCFTRDVTAQRHSEGTVRHWAAIVESSDDAILSKDLNGTITSWNRSAERIFGYAPDDVIGRPVTILIPTDRAHEEAGILARLRRGERIEHYETVRRRKNGELLHVSLTISPIKNSQGKIVGASKIARDINEKKRAEAALESARQEIAAANAVLEQRVAERTASLTDLLAQMESFSYAVSHDLRSPLRAMAGFAAVLQQDHAAGLDDDARHLLNRIIRASERMSRLINDLLAYARINRDRMELEPVSLGGCLEHVIQYAPELQAPRADIVIRGRLPAVLGSEVLVTQIFANILGNAVKFVAPGRTPRVEISAEVRNKTVWVMVADNGIGIQPGYQTKLFGLFERLNVDKGYEGSGMGLAIVRRALERMGGRISVESDGVTGSCFLLEFRPAPETRSGAQWINGG